MSTSELVERLRDMRANFVEFSQTSNNNMHRRLYFNRAEVSRLAADLIDKLERENARMRAALEPFADWADHYRASTHDHYVPECEIDGPGHSLTITLGDFRKARAALAQDDAP